MSQVQQDIQLRVWKDLAISKQILMRAATDALKLDPECTQDELKEALEAALNKAARADTELSDAKKEAAAAIAALEKKLAESEQGLASAQKAADEAKAAYDGAVQQMANQRAAAATELQKVKDRLAECEKSLKAINTALSDTPANVLKKMNALKKQKQQEADARRQIEAALNALRTEKRQQEQRLADLTRNGATLVSRHRDLYALSSKLHEQLQTLVEDTKSLPQMPELETTLLEAVERPAEGSQKRLPRSSERPAAQR